jgi:integrase/recombinase XerD
VERGLARNSVEAYASDLEQFLSYLNGRDPLALSRGDLEDYLWELRSVRELAVSSLTRKIEALRSFFAFQAAERRLENNPAAELRSPRRPGRLPEFLTAAEIDLLLAAPGDGSYEHLRAQAMIELLYATGMRVSEIVALRPEYVNLEDGWVRVLGKGSKERLIPVHERALESLKRFLLIRRRRFPGSSAAEVFLSRGGGRLSRSQFWRDLRALGKRAGLEARVHPHVVRHTFATHVLQGGADLRSVQEMLGHSSLATTQIYTHLEKSALKDSHRRHHPRG